MGLGCRLLGGVGPGYSPGLGSDWPGSNLPGDNLPGGIWLGSKAKDLKDLDAVIPLSTTPDDDDDDDKSQRSQKTTMST